MPAAITAPVLISAPKLVPCRATASLTYSPGDFLQLDANGRVAQALAANANSAAGTKPTHFAISSNDPTRTLANDDEIHLVPIDNDFKVQMCLSAGDAVQAWSNTYSGEDYDLRRTTAGIYTINVSSDAQNVFLIDNVVPGGSSDTCAQVDCAMFNSRRGLAVG